jgi:hypothetical protein
VRLKHDDFWFRVPLSFQRAFEHDEINSDQFTLGVYLAACCFEAVNTGEGVAIVRTASLCEQFGWSRDKVTRLLHSLDAEWIACDVGQGGRSWRVVLTGLGVPAQDVPHDFRTTSAAERSSVRKLTSAGAQSVAGANADDERLSAALELPQERSDPEYRRDETIRDERKPGFEEEKRQALGEARAEEAANDAPFLAEIEALKAEGVLIERSGA